jgi:hypothetical protein
LHRSHLLSLTAVALTHAIMAAARLVSSAVLLLLTLSLLARVDAQVATMYSFCWAVQSASYSSFISGVLTINPTSVTVPGNTGNQQGYTVLTITGTRNFTDLTSATSTVSTIAGLMPAGSLGGNDNILLLGSWPLLDGAGLTVNFASVPPIFGQYSALNQTTQLNMRWGGTTFTEQNQNMSRESAASTSSFTVAATTSGAAVPACQYYIQPLGWYVDSTAQTQMSEASQAVNDLHCNPPQQFTTLPAAGAIFESFSTFYDASSVSAPSTPVVRMALYQVSSSGTWSLLVGTQNGSDLLLTPGSIDGGTLATSSGPFYYAPNVALPVMIFPNSSYALCFSNNAGNLSSSGTANMFLWPQGGNLQNYALQPYYLTQQLPLTYPASAALQTGVTDTWQIWMTVAAPGAGPATGGTPTPQPATSPDFDSASCYGSYLVSPQNVTTFNYQYTLGCAPGGYSYGWQAPAGGAGCTSETNATGGSFLVVNITLVMLLSATPVYGSGPTTAFQICSLLPGSTRTVGTWVSAQSGLVWQTTDLEIVQVPPGFGSATLGMGWNNWFYPYSASNGPNGPVSASPYGWQVGHPATATNRLCRLLLQQLVSHCSLCPLIHSLCAVLLRRLRHRVHTGSVVERADLYVAFHCQHRRRQLGHPAGQHAAAGGRGAGTLRLRHRGQLEGQHDHHHLARLPEPAGQHAHDHLDLELRLHGHVQRALQLHRLQHDRRLLLRQLHSDRADRVHAHLRQRRQLALHRLRAAARLHAHADYEPDRLQPDHDHHSRQPGRHQLQ